MTTFGKRTLQPTPFTLLAATREKHKRIRIVVPTPPPRPLRPPTTEYLRAMREAELVVWVRALKVRARGAIAA
jgi:hypothetical protein